MDISRRLQELRKSNGLSQEKLAEILGVSRQAVGKWEQRTSIPELDKLVLISDYFRISIDRLIREEACNLTLIDDAGDDQRSIIPFLLRAKKSTYAGHGSELISTRPSSHDLDYREGDLYYYDTYLGSERFSGEEAVWVKDQPIWSMNYVGRVMGEGFSGDFLKAALAQVAKDKPYRGPMIYREGDYSYHCKVEGEFSWYQGYEEIFLASEKIYECYFHGGSVV